MAAAQPAPAGRAADHHDRLAGWRAVEARRGVPPTPVRHRQSAVAGGPNLAVGDAHPPTVPAGGDAMALPPRAATLAVSSPSCAERA